jgi:hypothetical protein
MNRIRAIVTGNSLISGGCAAFIPTFLRRQIDPKFRTLVRYTG